MNRLTVTQRFSLHLIGRAMQISQNSGQSEPRGTFDLPGQRFEIDKFDNLSAKIEQQNYLTEKINLK